MIGDILGPAELYVLLYVSKNAENIQRNKENTESRPGVSCLKLNIQGKR